MLGLSVSDAVRAARTFLSDCTANTIHLKAAGAGLGGSFVGAAAAFYEKCTCSFHVMNVRKMHVLNCDLKRRHPLVTKLGKQGRISWGSPSRYLSEWLLGDFFKLWLASRFKMPPFGLARPNARKEGCRLIQVDPEQWAGRSPHCPSHTLLPWLWSSGFLSS